MNDHLPCSRLRDAGHERHAAEVVKEDGGEPDRVLHVIVDPEPTTGFGAEACQRIRINLVFFRQY
jgi:hypothetical protein